MILCIQNVNLPSVFKILVMRKISFLFCISLSLLANSMFSQTTGNFNYQAVVRDSEGNLITNKSMSVQLSIIESTADGNEIYVETHSVT